MKRSLTVMISLAFLSGLSVQAAQAPDAKAAPSGFKAEAIRSLEDAEKKIIALAEAMPEGKYSWKPEGARSVGEVYMHIAMGNYFQATMLGVPVPQGVTRESLEKISAKGEIVDALKKSYAHVHAAILGVSDLDKQTKLYGREGAMREAVLIIVAHNHEHLGQCIAYARMNGVVPPWTAERQKSQQPAKKSGS
jgi:uncharacterized damage-inducible protein DinB